MKNRGFLLFLTAFLVKSIKADDIETSDRFFYNNYPGYGTGNYFQQSQFNQGQFGASSWPQQGPFFPGIGTAGGYSAWQGSYFNNYGAADGAPQPPQQESVREQTVPSSDIEMTSLKCGIRNPDPAGSNTVPTGNILVPRKRHVEIKENATGENSFEERGRYDDDQDEDAFRIVGGRTTAVDYWPWQVSLRYGGIHYCGGSILNHRYILTAAHCFDTNRSLRSEIVIDTVIAGDIDINDWTIYAAKSLLELDEPGEIGPLEIESITIHPNYNKLKQFDSDLALIRLKTPLQFSNKVYPICLPRHGSTTSIDNECFVTGFGKTQGTGGRGHLKAALVPILGSSDCGMASRNSHLTRNMLCAGYLPGGTGSCQGDSGGPLSCVLPHQTGASHVFVLQGVVSFGYECAGRNQPSVYVRVANYVDWIKQTVINYRQAAQHSTTPGTISSYDSTTSKHQPIIDNNYYLNNYNKTSSTHDDGNVNNTLAHHKQIKPP